MNYGVRLTRHVLLQVFGNLGQAARITLLPLVVFFVLLTAVAAPLVGEYLSALEGIEGLEPGGPPPELPPMSSGNVAFLLFMIPLGLIVFSWVAVGWHRYVLLEEYPLVAVPRWSFDRILSYIGRTLILSGILLAVAFIASFVSIALVQILGAFAGAGLLIAMTVALSWAFTRMGLILPATAVDTPLSISESWAVTARASGEIFVPILAFAIAFTLIGQILGLIFGATILGTIVSAALSWVQMLCNLALLTTLYGSLVERRDLN
ncbi:MAG: hypothetical protein AAFN09_11085 [Pseudomonadota bacterium]